MFDALIRGRWKLNTPSGSVLSAEAISLLSGFHQVGGDRVLMNLEHQEFHRSGNRNSHLAYEAANIDDRRRVVGFVALHVKRVGRLCPFQGACAPDGFEEYGERMNECAPQGEV